MEDNKNKTKVDLMYDDLHEQGYLEKDRDTFNKFFYAPGEQGYKNRKALYDDLHEQGYLESPTYEDFARGIGLHAADRQQPSSGNTGAAASGVVGGVAGGLEPGSYVQAFAQGTQGNGRPDMVESLSKYYEGLQAQNAPQASANTKQPEAPAPSTSGSSNAPKSSTPKMVRQEDLYVDDKGNPALGTSEEDSRDIERSELYYPLMRNDSVALGSTQAYKKGWLAAPKYDKNKKFKEARAAGYKAQGEKFRDLSDEELVQAMREEEKKLDGSTSPEALQASMNVAYIETLMAAREWGLGDVANFNATRHMVDYHQAKGQYNKNGLVDKYEKNMLTGRDDNPLLIRGWELIEEQYLKDEADGNLHKSSYYRNLPFHDPKFAEEFGAYITARIKVTGERWNDAVKDAIDDFEAAAAEGRVGQRHSEEYLGSANREQVDDMLDQVNSALKKRTGELDDKFMNESWFQRMGESSLDPENPSSRYLSDPDASNLIWAGRALQDAKKIIAAFDANRLEDGLTGFFKGAGRGLVDSLGDLSTWDGGISDLLSAQRLDAAVDKFKKGKPLSASEKALLEATSLKLATAEIFKEVGRGYKAGTVTGESLPFMVEMALNPIAKSGDKIASGLARYANKYLGKYLKKMVSKLGRSSAGKIASKIIGSGATKTAGKVAARVVGDIAAAGGMSTTSGVGHSLANTIGYHSGDVQYQQGAGGKTHFGDVKGGDDWVTATLKGFASTTIENASEMWGEYFKPITNFLSSVGGKTLEKMHLGRINKWLSDLNSTEMARLLGDFRKQTRWDGSIAEYFEEVAGNIANALTVKDMNFALTDKNGKLSFHEEHSVFNAQDNLDTFLGVSLMSGAMSTAKIVGYRTPTYRAKQDVKRYGDMAKRIFGGHGNDWSTIANLIQDNSEEARKQLVVDLMQSGKYSKREKQIALQYAGAVYKSMGMDLGESKQKRSAGDQEASDAYGRGYNMANLENISETSSAYNQLRSQMEQEYGTELMERMDSEPGLVYGWVRAGAVSEEDAKKVLDYLNAKMAYDGAMDRLNDDDAAAKAAAEAHVDDTIHTEENGGDGQIHPVALKGREGDFFVVSGNVVTDNNGNVDVDASDNEIVVVDSNGKRTMTTAKDIAQVGDAIDPDAAKAQAVASIESVSAQASGTLDTGANQVEGDETLDGTDLDSDEVAAPDGATQQDASSIQAPLPVTEYNQDDLVTVEVDGQRVNGIVTNGLDSNGNVTLYLEEPINGRQNVQLTPEQLNQVAVSYTSRDGVTITRGEGRGERGVETQPTQPGPQAPQQQQAPGAPVQEQAPVSGESGEPLQQPAANGELDVQTGETPQTPNAPVAEAPQQAPAQPSLPVGEDGNADFSNASVQEAHDYIYNDPELDEDEANQVVQNYADSAAEELAKAQAVLDELKSLPAPQMKDYGRDTAGYKRDKKERNDSIAQAQAAVDAAQRDVDLWNGVQAQHMMNRATAKANRGEESGERGENPTPAPVSGESENNAPTPTQANPAQGQQTTESTQEPSAPQPNEGNGPVASTSPATGVDTQPQEEGNEGDGEDQNPGDSGESASPEASGVETRELTPDERIERARMEALENRAEELAESCGLPVQVARSLDDLSDSHRREVEKQHAEGKYVNGFYDPMTKQIVLFLPDIAKNGGLRRLERTFLHEGVAHGGLRALFENAQNGIQTFDDLCDQVWEMMPVLAQAQMMNYIGVQKPEDMTQEKKRIAADEYMAHLAELGVEQSVKSRIINAIKNALRKIGIKMRMNNNDIVSLLAASRRNLNEMDKVAINSAISEAMDNDGEGDGEGVRMSTTAIFEGAGLEVSRDVTDKEGKPTKEPLTDSKGNLVARIGDKEYSVDNPVTAADLKEGDKEKKERTVLQMLINDALAIKNITEKQANKIYQNYADLLNMYLYIGRAIENDPSSGPEAVISNWEWLGDSVFRTIAANGDAQYSYSMDIIRVCKKNEAVIKAMSALQLREGRGATPSEIVELYRETHMDGYQVPCPVCYVFTRYIRNGKYASAAIKGMEKWGDHLPGGSDVWNVDQWLDALDKIQRETNPDYKPDGKNKMKGEELEKAKRFKKQLDQANKITVAYEKRVNALSYLLTTDDAIKAGTIKNKKLELTPERRASIEKELEIINEQYQHAVEIIAHQALSNWIKTHAIEEKDGKWQMREDARKPEDIDDYKRNALDLRLTSNTIVNYPAIQRLRKSGGSAAGKEISFASDNRLGEVISGLGINKTNLSGYKNKYEEALNATGRARNKARNEARKRFKDATVYALMQTLRGGQRMWSWSDNIERLSPDIAINIMQLQLLGGAMQTYSKQLEGIKLAAQMGAYVNGSLMAKDNGYQEVTDKDVEERDGKLWLTHDITDEVEEYPVGGGEPKPRKRIVAAKGSYVYQAEDGKKYVLIYDDVVGVDPFGNELHGKGKKKGLFQLNQEYDRAGNILVGMNDLHVRAAMADPRVFFIIPWHASGANNHILNQMLNILEQNMTDRLDYTAMQEEKNMLERNKNTKELPEVNQRLRDLWEEGRQWAKQYKWKSGMEVDSNGDVITESQYMYRQLRALIFNGNIFEAMPSEEQYRAAVQTVESMQPTVDAIAARNEQWKSKSPEYKKSPEGKAEKKAIELDKNRTNKKYKEALHYIELHDGLIDWRDSSQHEGDAEWQAQHPKRINVEEARRMIEADEFLSQVLKRVEPIGHMTNGDNTYIYPYEYWQETDKKGKPADIKDADINGKRYVEYCRRMGYKPKFSGRWGDKVTEENMNDGNFVHDPGYWKLLIDRRMYDRNGKYQWLDPVESENFEPDLVNPLKTGEEFNITQVADDKDAEDIAERVYNNMAERDGGVAKVDYGKPLEQIMDEYDAALSAGVQANVKLTDAEEDALDDMEEAMAEEAGDSGVMFSTSAIKAPEASDALAGYEKIHPKFKLKDGVKTLERFYKEGDIESLRIYRDSYMDSVKTWERDLKKDLKTGFYETSAVIRDDRALVEKYTKLKDYAEKLLADLVWGRDDYNPWGVKKNAEVSFDELDDLFARHNDDVTNSELWDRVLAVSRRLGVDNIKFKQLAKDEAGAAMGGRIRYQADYYNDYGVPDHLKTETLLHEMIHHVTSYAIRHPENLTADQKDAVERIKEVWMDIKFDPDFKGTYGITSPSEMVAELSNPGFRDKLKSKTYWEKLIDGVLRLLGIEREGANMTTAYDVVRRNLERLLSDPNLEAYNKHAETQRQFSPRFSTGWHGSGSEFDRFDHSHMGEGEGAQAYGWGTYITSVEGIGRSYATESAKKNPTYYWKGQKIDRASINPLSMAYDVVEREGTIKKAISLVDRFLDNPDAHENWAEVKEILKQSKKSDFTIKPARYLYEVEIPDNDGENYISWNETLPKKHRRRIANVVRELSDDLLQRDTHGPNWLRGGFEQLANTIEREQYGGKEITEKLRDALGNARMVSEIFSKAGFVGTEYPAQYRLGGRSDGAKNYVIYNEDDIEIKDHIRFSTTAAVDTLKDDERVYNTMLGKVFSGVSNETRRGIVEDAMRNRGNDFGAATEAWLMGLADNGKFAQVPEDDWRTVKNALSSTLRDMGVDGTMTDNEARYVLWKAGQVDDGVFSMAEDVVMQDKLLQGEREAGRGESNLRFSTSPAEQIYSDNFKDWFGDWENDPENASKVVDEDGRPKVVYRGDAPGRYIMDNAQGSFFSDRDDVTKGYAGKDGQINAVYLDIKNPAFMDNEASYNRLRNEINDMMFDFYDMDDGELSSDGRWRALRKYYLDFRNNEGSSIRDFFNDFLPEASEDMSHEELVENMGQALRDLNQFSYREADYRDMDIANPFLRALGYDGVIRDYDKNGQAAGKEYITFSPTQIKSATENNGGFSRENPDIRFSVTPRDRAIARDQYERWMNNWRIQFTEAFQDSMIGLKKLMQAIMGDEYGYIEDIPMYENPYIAENLMSPTTAAEQHVFDHDYMQPIFKEMANLCKGKRREREKAREDLTNYLMAKHGLERNQVLADRDAQETAQAGGNYQDAYAENRERDYSGLTALTGEDDVHAAEAKAKQMVDDYEAQHDTTELWSRIKAATQKTLEKQYKSGMLSYAEYQRISGMFEYYVPLRGWEETTSDEVYGYLTSKAGPFLGSSIGKRAGGRTSKADDPIANIAKLGDDSIRTGNRNLMKQMFLNFVQNHPSDLVSVSDLWLKYDEVTDEWVPVFADIKPKDSADVVEQKIQAFEQQMQELAEQEPDKYKHGREAANIPYRVVPGMEKEHQVLVKRNGQTWVLTINGNPRAAQALNGLTNPDVSTGTWADYIFKTEDAVNRMLSAMMTTYNPKFIVSNFARDTAYVNTMVWAKENKNYALAFHANHLKLNPAYMRFLLGRWENGTLDESKRYQKYFKEFMLNGGETGYAMAQDLDDYKKKINKELGIPNGNYAVTRAVRRVVSAATPEAAKKAGRILADQYELLGRSIENSARFAAFVTSREMGRDVKRSAYDAKEISVNFNKKGSGGKMFLRPGQTFVGNVASLVAALTRAFYTFFNAGVQGMTNVGRNLKRHPYKSSAGIASLLTMGIMQPMLAAMMGAGDGDDDDKNAYYNLPPYVRRSNLCIYLPGWIADKTKNSTVKKYMQGTWLCIPLPVEYRAIFGFGELMYSAISGNERYPDKWELAKETTAQFSQLLPVDFLEGGGGFSAFIPTVGKPMWEIHNNVGWSGAPIYKKNEWNKDDPEYTKAFSNTSEWLVDFTEWLNAKTLRNPEDEVGFLNWNPAKIEYFVKGYTGGVYSSIMEIMRAAQTAFGDREFEWRNVPLANRILKQSDERMESRNLMNEFYNLKEEYDKTKKDIDKYQKGDNTDYFDYAKKLSFLNYSDRYKRYLIMDEYMDELNGLSKDLKDAKELGLPEEEIAKAERNYMAKLHQMIDEIHKFEDTGNPPSYIPTLKRVDKSRDPKLIYSKHRLAEDIMNDNLLKAAIKRAKKEGNIGLQKALEGVSRSITDVKKELGYEGANVDEIMDSIRQLRDGALRSFGLLDGDEAEPEVEPDVPETEEPQEEWGDEGQDNVSEPEDDEFESFE